MTSKLRKTLSDPQWEKYPWKELLLNSSSAMKNIARDLAFKRILYAQLISISRVV